MPRNVVYHISWRVFSDQISVGSSFVVISFPDRHCPEGTLRTPRGRVRARIGKFAAPRATWGQHHLAILAALALTDPDDPSLAIDIRHPEVSEPGGPQAGSVDGRQDGAMFEVASGFEYGCDFGGTQDDREFLLVPQIRNMFNHPVAVQHVVIKKPQCPYGLLNIAHATFSAEPGTAGILGCVAVQADPVRV